MFKHIIPIISFKFVHISFLSIFSINSKGIMNVFIIPLHRYLIFIHMDIYNSLHNEHLTHPGFQYLQEEQILIYDV